MAFASVDSGRRFLACAQKEIPKCSYVEWVDPEWPAPLKMSLARIWGMFEDENKLRLRQNVVNAEDNCKILGEKEKMEKELRFFKVDFAQMVADKEQALAQLGNTQLARLDAEAGCDEEETAVLCAPGVAEGRYGVAREAEPLSATLAVSTTVAKDEQARLTSHVAEVLAWAAKRRGMGCPTGVGLARKRTTNPLKLTPSSDRMKLAMLRLATVNENKHALT